MPSKSRHLASAALAAALLALGACASFPGGSPDVVADSLVRRQPDGVIVTPRSGEARAVRLQVFGPRTIRVTASPDASFEAPASLMVTAEPVTQGFDVETRGDLVLVRAAEVTAEVSLETGAVRFLDNAGEVILAERANGREIDPIIVEDQTGAHRFETVRQVFEPAADDAIYGLGQHQQGVLNYRGHDVELAQHNMDVGVPFVASTGGYGLLWDNNSITRFGDPRPYGMLDERLTVRDATGRFGGLTASYFQGDELRVQRQEGQINYEYIRDQQRWPEGLKAQPAQPVQVGDMGRAGQEGVRVVWEGTIEAFTAGRHKFKLYSSGYAKVWIDGELRIDRWRQNWNPWFHDFDVELPANRQVSIKVEWIPGDGYIALRHLDPQSEADRQALSLWSQAGHDVDYYFVGGDDLDEVISGYRGLTGKAVMLPRWAYGFWQSRQRYNTQTEVVDTVRRYRELGLPIDNVVQDWFYWPENAWGSHDFDPARFPNPTQMVKDVHDMDANIIISVWPKFYPTTDHYRELAAIGGMYTRNVEAGARDWVGPGYANSFYDPYLPAARDLYWRQISDSFRGMGFDGWWLDSVEPDMHSNLDIAERTLRMGPTAAGPGALVFNSYPLVNAETVYQRFRAEQPDTRTYILTRSAWGGLQRTGSTLWSGDVVARWDNLGEQISAGVNAGLSGIPNWTHDIGGFSVEARYQAPQMKPEDRAEWDELQLRWFQFGAFSPVFRSHGEFPLREVYNLAEPDGDLYDAFAAQMRLRYRLMPYIYTLAGDTWHRDGTIMRALAMDFPQDVRGRDVNDQYLFGPAIMVAPVHRYQARERSVWFPTGADWFDLYTGRKFAGGSEATVQAPLERIPLFVRAGSILPTGPQIQHTAEKLDGPITLTVYAGADGSFELYDDAGTTYGYERGEFSRIPMAWDQARGVLTIGARSGTYPGMPANRTFHIRWIDGPTAAAVDFDAAPARTVEYSGQAVQVSRP
ncbi:TIM-barrel domain-containing protein [Brevundimonas sp.]|uniref:glycoside hydrolase family 31 protein n=1 Tax=Brevundimonas sp. TaxID=1871086 RepID=UPI0027378B19|nr:TIM-barrel domain-containing protein [Brevundimonas sp.]MDP3801886.1 glycoside hydrolase family 31 protein [Brevundimonas sp.]